MPSGRRGNACAARRGDLGPTHVRVAHHPPQRGTREELEAHERRHRVARQPEHRHAPHDAERERLRRLDRDLAPLERAEPVERGLHVVVVADRHAAAREDGVAADRAPARAYATMRVLVVARDAEVDGSTPASRASATSIGRFESRIWPGRERRRRLDELVAGGEHTDAGAAVHVHVAAPTLASTPTCAGPSTVPAGNTTSPASQVAAGARTWSPAVAPAPTSTPSSPSRCVRSTITTRPRRRASAPRS